MYHCSGGSSVLVATYDRAGLCPATCDPVRERPKLWQDWKLTALAPSSMSVSSSDEFLLPFKNVLGELPKYFGSSFAAYNCQDSMKTTSVAMRLDGERRVKRGRHSRGGEFALGVDRWPGIRDRGQRQECLAASVSTCPPDQKEWLVEKFELYKEHHDKKTLGQFFPPLYEEYFARWPPTPTDEELEAAGGKTATAVAGVRTLEEHRVYRWMFNRSRSKHGSSGKGSLVSLNLTAGSPKKKAAVQTYVKHFWEDKIKQEVISNWAPTMETDLFGEIDMGEDQVAWEEMTPMEKEPLQLSFLHGSWTIHRDNSPWVMGHATLYNALYNP
ncbi:hypothetical protein BJ322DRAFT_1020909 [Thelephora terrestris]|uniref:Uncharacterized protein n=1 Tax=Thelephora terrestris TaxID=56493 RepID=A0A9P6HG07_9AGAM|nr:hypothetical protein BJ322DRAFT_1020909 [Thelephora terrestris]